MELSDKINNEKSELIKQKQELLKKKPQKGPIYVFNLVFLILGIFPTGYFGIFLGLFMAIVGVSEITHLSFLVILGEILIITGFVLSAKREKLKIRTSEKQEGKKESMIRKILEITISIVGIGLMAIGVGILTTMEWDIW